MVGSGEGKSVCQSDNWYSGTCMLVSQNRITWADMLVGCKYVKQLA